jgi:uncharacterized delta-60 repeat protein
VIKIAATFVGMVAVLASATAAVAALPGTTAGSPDPTFGTAGRVAVNPTPLGDDWGGGVLQPDGKLVVTGYVARTATTSSIAAIRMLDNGALDPSFGTGGIAALAIDNDAGADYSGPALDASGRILIAGYSNPDTLFRCTVVALRADGRLDASFGNAGAFRFQSNPGKHTNCASVAVQGDGKLIVLGIENGSPGTSFVLRLTAAGVLDTGFSTQGILRMPTAGGIYWYAARLGGDGSIFVVGVDSNYGYVMKFTAAGIPDASFAANGVFQTPFANTTLYPPKVLADGALLVPGYRGSKHMVLRLTPAGAPDPAFGVGGVADFAYGFGYSAIGADVQQDGKIVVALRLKPTAGSWRLAATRLNANGTTDTTYGTAGLSIIDSGGVDDVNYGMALAPDGRLWMFGRADLTDTDSALAVGRLIGTETTTGVVEFFNSILNHYFITADPNEAAAIDGGSAGPGWTRTGQTWKSGGPARVCRFYGVQAAGGPNGHFYTIDSAECAAVKLDPGWHFESYDFAGWPVSSPGVCRAGTIPVKRAYNGRFAQHDSNHRYATSDAIYNQMVASGWSGEGVVFCSVQ